MGGESRHLLPVQSGGSDRREEEWASAWRRSPESTRGSVSLELIGSLPLIALGLLIAVQVVCAGYALWSAGLAARAGARSVLTGRDPEGAVRRALPPGLSVEVRVERRDGVTVAVPVPRVLPGLPEFEVDSSSDFGR